jgi:hypothetical protein
MILSTPDWGIIEEKEKTKMFSIAFLTMASPSVYNFIGKTETSFYQCIIMFVYRLPGIIGKMLEVFINTHIYMT